MYKNSPGTQRGPGDGEERRDALGTENRSAVEKV